MALISNKDYRLTPTDHVKYDATGTEINLRPHIVFDGATFQIYVDANVMALSAGIDPPTGQPTTIKTQIAAKAYSLTDSNLLADEPQIVARLNAVLAALEKVVKRDLEAVNTNTTFTRS